ncbi:putative ubiquitin carboxyl-terminal hydrolase 19 [Erysiphe neolycopersici]|uniref:Putative ubiquitin carboxyl-terminal hydrolase 19 n=1 Tax=Erysiphe neolycopersici TaxID=212602 RepID=A0A420HTU0_9PEZI|nr:putative ubiquitin carboxyl-terminal hydrolase 19 [Erysiphe neolycopersici]
MDSQCTLSWEDVKSIQTSLKQVQATQLNHSERLLKLEKRQADDAAIKSVWGSNTAFPNILSGTPQPDPLPILHDDVFDKFDGEQGQNILKSLQLEDDEEPARRGTSRTNSVRFDITALQSSSWSAPGRNSGDFVPIRPCSSFGNNSMMERSLSHKSDGRQSSTGHSLPDFFSIASGRSSSLGLDLNYEVCEAHHKEAVHDPPPGMFILGPVPSIIRCWLAGDFSHDSLIYAAVCSGSQRSIIHYSLVRELGLQDLIEKKDNGQIIIKLTLYLPEATIIQPTLISNSINLQLPIISTRFEVIGVNRKIEHKKNICVFLGNDTLRSHNADILFSRNLMTAYGDDKCKLSIPFVRPEDDDLFKNLCITNISNEKVSLKATATPFTPVDTKSRAESKPSYFTKAENNSQCNSLDSTRNEQHLLSREKISTSLKLSDGLEESSSINSGNTALAGNALNLTEHRMDNNSITQPETEISVSDVNSQRSSNVILGSWRQEKTRNWSQSGYQPAKYGGNRSMKILKSSSKLNSTSIKSTLPLNSENPSSSSSSSSSSSHFKTTSSYDSPPLDVASLPPLSNSEHPGKKHNFLNGSGAGKHENGLLGRWDSSRRINLDEPRKLKNFSSSGTITSTGLLENSSNPIGGASAFAWMNSGKIQGNIKHARTSVATAICENEDKS